MTQRGTWFGRWLPLVLLLAASVLVLRAWLSIDLLLGGLNLLAFCG